MRSRNFRFKFCSLKKNAEFRYVYSNGKSYANTFLAVYVVKNIFNETRVGVSAGKKVGKSVVRNRVKRRVKEACRHMWKNILPGCAVVVVVRAAAAKAGYARIAQSLASLFKRHGIYNGGDI
ncbi:MAG: ribonuclease P protein component [Clostridiales bacterium]|jgi:ribonuclease P protein component|nr:ribonuclease P protein component [Clostridiales bacterium]